MLLIIGSSFILGMRLMGGSDQDKVSSIWPEKGPAPSIQFAISSLKVNIEHKSEQYGRGMGRHHRRMMMQGPPDMNLEKDLNVLEQQGIQSVVTQDGNIIYVSPGADSNTLMNTVNQYSNNAPIMLWDDDMFVFSYQSTDKRTNIYSYGKTPFLTRGEPPEPNPYRDWDDIILIVIIVSIIFIIVLGLYISRLLSRQILEPLSALREASAEIRRGNLDKPISIEAQDEFGDACRDFEEMRIELKEARRQQEKYEQNRKELIAGISHDLSTPLTALKGYASGILDGIANTPEKQRHYVEMILQGASTMEKLVSSLFLFSKLDLGRIPFNMETVALCDYFTDFYNEQQPFLAEKNLYLSLELALPDDDHGLVYIDRMQFQRIIDNLLTNSIKYAKDNSVKVRICLSHQEQNLRIEFRDNGQGVDTEDLPKLFDSFYRTDPARSNVSKGSGLGLAITKQLILGMKGQIWAENNSDGGLTIIILLPRINTTTKEATP
ncbi:MAG: HAMP domain-containing histidine kinase [Anaerovibrio sp.]|uniref:sensor histidine kinase n=1 Tax=Anaerovibrio sp. TaxID=1872532 RepID=UPI0025D50615|nr:HAMP domain-containing sensor histidine kinase [Anaerovibrio sp.]MCR5175621.1 HAMP domain-containing histidine kinase [Anaerovibrio sp.]